MSIRVVLFDLGGVLVRIGGVAETLRDARGLTDPDAVLAAWIGSPSVLAFEEGRLEPRGFASSLIAELDLQTGPEAFLEDFATWPLGLYEGAVELLDALRGRAVLACFSNTNAVHWPRMRDTLGLASLLDRTFVSFELGLCKPRRDAFAAVVDSLGCSADEVLFLDDAIGNVEGARAAGLHAELARGAGDATRIVREWDLIPR